LGGKVRRRHGAGRQAEIVSLKRKSRTGREITSSEMPFQSRWFEDPAKESEGDLSRDALKRKLAKKGRIRKDNEEKSDEGIL